MGAVGSLVRPAVFKTVEVLRKQCLVCSIRTRSRQIVSDYKWGRLYKTAFGDE